MEQPGGFAKMISSATIVTGGARGTRPINQSPNGAAITSPNDRFIS